MGTFDFLNPAKHTAASGSKWAIKNFLTTKQINPSLSDREVVNNLLAARYLRVSLESDQEVRLSHYESLDLADALELVMATLDIELEVNPLHNPDGFLDAASVVQRKLSRARIPCGRSAYEFEDKWNRIIRPLRTQGLTVE